MYLSLLNIEQKKLYYSLAYNLAVSDGDYSDYEKQVINSYVSEMNLKFNMEFIDENINRVLDKLNQISEKREKKIIVFEMIGLAMADNKYEDVEKEIVRKAISVFELDNEFGLYCEKKLTEYFCLQEDLNNNILS